MECEYCNETVHHEFDMVTDEHYMCYHVWCYERIQEAEQEIKTGERIEDLL